MFCTKCGRKLEENQAFCPGCGNALVTGSNTHQAEYRNNPQTQPQQTSPQYAPPQTQRSAVACVKCGNTNISYQVVNTQMGTRNRARGCLWALGRWMLIICTCGLWLLVGRSKGKSNTTIKTETQAVCQNCGNRWTV